MYTIRKSFDTPHFFSEASLPAKGPTEAAPAMDSVDQLIAQAKGKLEEAKRLNDDIIAGRLLHDSFVAGKDSTVEGLLLQIDTKNSANKAKIDTLVSSALNDSEWKKDPKMYAELQKLATKFKTENTVLVEQKAVAKDAVVEKTEQKVAVEKKSAPSYAKGVSVRMPEKTGITDSDRLSGKIEKESNPDKKKFLEHVNVLCDFDGSWGVESKNEINILSANSQKQEIGELQTANILIDQFGDNKKLEGLLSRFSGKDVSLADLDNPEKAKGIRESFVKNVIAKANLMSQISRVITGNPDASAGLISVLNGTEKQFIENLKLQNPDLSKLTEAGKKDKGWFQMAVNFLMSLGVQVATGGLFSVGVEHREIGEGHPFAYVLGDKVNFTAKVRALAGVVQGNWNDRERAIIKTTTESAKSFEGIILKSDFDVAKSEKDIVALIPESQKEKTAKLLRNLDASFLSNEASKKAFIDVLTRNVMIGLAEKESGKEMKGVEASLDIASVKLFIGLVGQKIHTKIRDGVFTGANLAETAVNGGKKKLSELGIKYEKTPEGKYSYSLPADMESIQGLESLGVVTKGENGALNVVSEKPLQFYKTSNYKLDGSIEDTWIVSAIPNGEVIKRKVRLDKYESATLEKQNKEYIYSFPSDITSIDLPDALGKVEIKADKTLFIKSGKPLEFYKVHDTSGKLVAKEQITIQPDKIPDMFSTDVKEAFAKYPGYREWRRVFPQTFGIIRENLLVNGDADKALADARKKVKPTAEFGKFLASLDAKTPEQKSEILSALINENAGVARFRQYGADGKKETETFGKVYSSTKSDKRVDAAFDENEARTLYGKSHADMMKDQSPAGDEYRKLYTEKVELRSSNKATLTQSKEKTKPIEMLSADTGFFTFQNFAEYNGKGTRFHALKSQPTSQVLAGTVKEMTSFPDSAKKELLAQSAADKRYNKRFDALLTSINAKLPADKKVDKTGLLTILQGDTVSGVKLSEPLKFYRAESAVCANDMITIGKPKFKIEGNTEEVTVTDVPDVSEDVIVGTTAIMGERKAEVTELSVGVSPTGLMDKINKPGGEDPTTNPGGNRTPTTNPGGERGTVTGGTDVTTGTSTGTVTVSPGAPVVSSGRP